MTYSGAHKRMLLALTSSALLLFAAASQAVGLEEKLNKCLAQANGDVHEVSQCYWRHSERQASFGR